MLITHFFVAKRLITSIYLQENVKTHCFFAGIIVNCRVSRYKQSDCHPSQKGSKPEPVGIVQV